MPTYYDPNFEIHNTNTEVTFTVDFSEDKKNIVLREKTGVYNATTNPTGWDAVDAVSIDNVTAAVLRMELPNGNVYDGVIHANDHELMPGTDGLASFILGPGDFIDGNSDPYTATEFPEGAYSFYLLYTVLDADTVPNLYITGIYRTLFAPTSEGYVQEAFTLLKPGCTCKNSAFEKAKLIDLYYKAAYYAAKVGDNTKTDEYLAYVAKLSNKTVGCISC
jgi:hypothetical protein